MALFQKSLCQYQWLWYKTPSRASQSKNARPGKKFDGENHAAVFSVREKHFEGMEYLPSFAWLEVEESDIDPSEKITGMVSKSDEVKFEEQCRDMQKIHQGNLSLWSIPKPKPQKKDEETP